MKQVFAKIDEDGSGAIDLREVCMNACRCVYCAPGRSLFGSGFPCTLACLSARCDGRSRRYLLS